MLNGVSEIQNWNLKTNSKMTRVMCNFWTKTFTLAHLAPLTMFSPTMLMTNAWYKIILKRFLYVYIDVCPN